MFRLTIPKPCHEDWDKMTPEAQGRFCAACQKTVFDFTDKTDEEIFAVYQANNGNLCGRVKASQLDPESLPAEGLSPFWRLFLAALVAAFLGWLFLPHNAWGQNPIPQEYGVQDKPNAEQPIRILVVKNGAPVPNIAVRFTVEMDGKDVFAQTQTANDQGVAQFWPPADRRSGRFWANVMDGQKAILAKMEVADFGKEELVLNISKNSLNVNWNNILKQTAPRSIGTGSPSTLGVVYQKNESPEPIIETFVRGEVVAMPVSPKSRKQLKRKQSRLARLEKQNVKETVVSPDTSNTIHVNLTVIVKDSIGGAVEYVWLIIYENGGVVTGGFTDPYGRAVLKFPTEYSPTNRYEVKGLYLDAKIEKEFYLATTKNTREIVDSLEIIIRDDSSFFYKEESFSVGIVVGVEIDPPPPPPMRDEVRFVAPEFVPDEEEPKGAEPTATEKEYLNENAVSAKLSYTPAPAEPNATLKLCELQARVCPNPNPGDFSVWIETGKVAPVLLKIIDAVGKIVYEKEFIPAQGRNEIPVSIHNFGPGLYTLSVQQSGETAAMKVSVHR